MGRKKVLLISAISVVMLSCICPFSEISQQIIDQLATQDATEGVGQLPSITPVTEDQIKGSRDTFIYQGNLERTGVYQSAGPKSSPELLWKFNTEGVISDSSPAVYRRVAYIGSEYGLYAVDIQIGKSLWIYLTNGSVHTSPSIKDGIIYFGSEDGLLHALDSQTGREEWRFEVAGNVEPIIGSYKAVYASPAISNGSILFGNTQIGEGAELHFYALDARTGKKRWEHESGFLTSSPAVYGGIVYMGGFKNLIGLDVVSGFLAFHFSTDGGTSAPAILDGIAYFGCDNGNLHALDLETGDEIWVFDTGRSVTIDTAPSVADGVVYAGSGDGFMYAVDLQTRQLLWEYETGGWISSSPVIVEGVLYFGSADGYLYALE